MSRSYHLATCWSVWFEGCVIAWRFRIKTEAAYSYGTETAHTDRWQTN